MNMINKYFIESVGRCRKILEPHKKKAYKTQHRVGYVYLIKDRDLYKIGMSENPNIRARQFNGNLVLTIPTYDMIKTESAIHEAFNDKRVYGEWFNLSDDDISLIVSIKKVLWYLGMLMMTTLNVQR